MTEMKDYYVSMIRGDTKKRFALMAGPFATHDEALAMVTPVKQEARRLDPWVDLDSFGTCSKPRSADNRDGWLNVYLGVKPRELTPA